VWRPSPAVLRLLVFLGGLAATVALLVALRDVFQPLLLGLGLAYVMNPAVSWLAGRGLSRTVATVVLAAVLAAVVAAVIVFVVPAIAEQVQRLTDRIPAYAERLQTEAGPWWEKMRAEHPEEVARLEEQARGFFSAQLPRVLTTVASWLGQAMTSVVGFFVFLLNLVFVPVFAFYLLVDFPKLAAGLTELIPVPLRAKTLTIAAEVNAAIGSFLRGQLTIAVILALINAVGLTLLGVPLGLVLGLIAGLANMIPYMSLIVGLAPALLLCWVEHQSLALVLGVVGVFAAGNFLEGTVLSPRILGQSVNLHPVWIMLALIAGGSWFGIMGMLLAVPVAAALQVFIRHWLAFYRTSQLYLGEGAQ
jgi:predicted PurR-regulated permease PerM